MKWNHAIVPGRWAQKYMYMPLIFSYTVGLTPTAVLICFTFVQFLDQDRIVTASSTGAVTIFRHHQNNQVHAGKVVPAVGSVMLKYPRVHYG